MRKKQTYLAACMRQPADWLRECAAQPSKYMTRMDVALVRIALKRKTGSAA